MMQKISVLTLLCLAAGACADRTPEVAPEVLAARQEADRRACFGEELLREAQEQEQMLSQSLGGVAGPAVGQFARAFAQHARLRLAAYAQTDSAFNHASTPADSTRHARAAESFEIRLPDPNSVEANVMRDYDRKLATLLADADHPCNWRSEIAEEEQR